MGLRLVQKKDNSVGLNFVGRANSSHVHNEANQTHIDNIPSRSQTRRILPRKQQRKQRHVNRSPPRMPILGVA